MATDPNSKQTREDPTISEPARSARLGPPAKGAGDGKDPDATRLLPSDSGAGPVRLALGLHEEAPRYESVGELGRGGMGEVHLCLDRRIGRRVALKKSTTTAAADPMSDRFLREICVQGQLEHPTVVPLHDLGVEKDGAVYFTMKHVRGRTLKNILAGLRKTDAATMKQFPPRKLLGAFANVCLGVAFAHSRGVIHRDLKPDNLMLGEFGEVYILDWGVAKVRDAEEPTDESVRVPTGAAAGSGTEAGSLIGSPGYMSPEQCMPDGPGVDERSDVYALGAILFEILAGESLHAGAALERMASTVAGADARVSVRAPERDAPPELEAVCAKATATLEDRTATARELHEALERHLSHDLNVELRRDLAAGHARSATQAAERAFASGPSSSEDRRRGLAEAGRALALDPSNDDAKRTLLRLLTEPPRETPAEVERELEEAMLLRRRDAGRLATLAGAILVLGLPALVSLGVVNRLLLWGYIATGGLFFLTQFINRLRSRPGDGAVLASMVVSSLFLCGMAGSTGPLFVVPGLATILTFAHLLLLDRHRLLTIALGYVPLVLPLVAQWAGLMLPSYAFDERGITIIPRLHLFPEGPTTAIMVSVNLVTLALCALSGVRTRQSAREAERSVTLQAWQLRQLIPPTSTST